MRHQDVQNPFSAAAVLRDRSAAEAAEALRPALPVAYASALALFVAAGVFFWLALGELDHCAKLAARV